MFLEFEFSELWSTHHWRRTLSRNFGIVGINADNKEGLYVYYSQIM